MLRCIRRFFDERGYLEVETPVLSQDVVVDAWIDPLALHDSDAVRFLQTSPEALMKRLLAEGSGSVYQIAHVFRQGETGRLHNTEFTMVEWYGVRTTMEDQMELVEALVRSVCQLIRQEVTPKTTTASPGGLDSAPFLRSSYEAAFERGLGARVLELSTDELVALAARHGVAVPESVQEPDKDDILNVLLSALVEPQLGISHPEYLHHYPISQAALAEADAVDPRTALRFELYIDGIELCNGYQELTDPIELHRRDTEQNRIRKQDDRLQLPGAPRLSAAMQHGLPECSGVALGFDRLAMVALGLKDIRQVLPFPSDIA